MLRPIKAGIATAALTTSLVALTLAAPAQAEMRLTRISVSQSQGDDGALPKLPISPHWGLALSFIKTGEQIQQVRVGDPSRIVTAFDSPLEGQQGGGASVIYLRELSQPLDMDLRLPGAARHSNQVPLTVITQSRQGLNFYQFQLSLGEATEHSAVEVVPDALMPRPQRPPVRVEIRRDIKPGELPVPPLEPTEAKPIRLKPVVSPQPQSPQIVQAS